MPATQKFALGLTIAALLVFAAAFMPWGTINGVPNMPNPFGGNSPFGNSSPFGGNSPFGGANPFQGMDLHFTVTGWNGSISLLGLSLPNCSSCWSLPWWPFWLG